MGAALYHFPAGVLCTRLCAPTICVPVPFPVFQGFFCCGHGAHVIVYDGYLIKCIDINSHMVKHESMFA